MKSSPLPRSARAPATPNPAADRVPVLSKIVGLSAGIGGVGLTFATLVAWVDGFAECGFFDFTIGAMYVWFGWYAMKYGYKVATGRQTAAGQAVA